MRKICKKILERAGYLRVLTAGDIMLDRYDFCDSAHSRPSPERPDKKVYTAHRFERMPGGAGNVAANLASLGVQAPLLSICGDDGNALEIRQLCEDADVQIEAVADPTRRTTVKTRLYIDDQYLLRRDDEDLHKTGTEIAAELILRFQTLIEASDAVILSDYNKGFFSEETAQAFVRECRRRDVPVVVDLKPPNAALFGGASVAAPNLKEAREICPAFDPDCPYRSLAALHARLGAEQIAVTLGGNGMWVYDGDAARHVAGRSVPVVDPCGCGDTVRACIALGLACGIPLADAAEFANYAASLAVQKLGTAVLTMEELLLGSEE